MKRKNFKDWIVQEDDHLIVINKPAGISSLDERTGEAESILSLAKKYCGTAQLCHRLDKNTSGLLLIAKDNETYRQVSELFRKRKVKKTYLAVAEGRQTFEDLEVDLPISVTSRGKAKVDYRGGKPAQTVFDTIEVFGHYSLIRCRPVTGRLHQIRIHLATQNAPIAGDDAYGGKAPYLSFLKRNFNMGRGREENPMISRFALHASELDFELNEKKYHLVAELPKDMEVFLKLLKKFDV